MLEAQTDSRGAMQAPGVNLQRSMQRYLASTGYRAIPVLEGSMVFTVHAASNRGVAVCRGTYDRAALRQLMSEVKSMGLSGYTVLVDGLILACRRANPVVQGRDSGVAYSLWSSMYLRTISMGAPPQLTAK